jgi:hypothetical protein
MIKAGLRILIWIRIIFGSWIPKFWKMDPDRHEIELFLEAGYGSGSVWSCNIVGSWIRIHIRVKSWIRIRIKVINVSKALRHTMGPRRAVDSHNEGLKVQNGALEGLQSTDHRSYHFEEVPGLDPHKREKLDPDPH